MHKATALSCYFKKLEETHRAVEVLRPAWNQKQAVLESTIDYVKKEINGSGVL
jgi:hypothetical protein